jgi:hypothetical protein
MKINIALSKGNHVKRKRRLAEAVRSQDDLYNVSQFIQVMEKPEFASYFANQFQAYLHGKQDIVTLTDAHGNDDAFLDVVMFLQTYLNTTDPEKGVSLADREESLPHRNSRMGSRKGMTHLQVRNQPLDQDVEV